MIDQLGEHKKLAKTELIDRHALRLHRRRVCSGERAFFLHQAAWDELEIRLQGINRSFDRIAIVTGSQEFWATTLPRAKIFDDDERLQFGRQPFDLILHTMALHWSNDPVGQLIQCRHALVPDGLLLAVCLGGDTLKELQCAFLDAEICIYGGASPRVIPMGDVRDYGQLLQRAGYALPVTDRWEMKASYSKANDLMHDLRAMGENNALTGRRKTASSRQLFRSLEEIYQHRFANSEGSLPATFELVFMTGWAPSETQPRALRPGSATSRLADALKTVEHKMDT